MKNFEVTLTQSFHYEKTIIVEAENEKDAEIKVSDMIEETDLSTEKNTYSGVVMTDQNIIPAEYLGHPVEFLGFFGYKACVRYLDGSEEYVLRRDVEFTPSCGRNRVKNGETRSMNKVVIKNKEI